MSDDQEEELLAIAEERWPTLWQIPDCRLALVDLLKQLPEELRRPRYR